MVQVTISASGRKSSLASDLPVVLDIPAGLDSATVEDVKAAFAAKYPKASAHSRVSCMRTLNLDTVLCI